MVWFSCTGTSAPSVAVSREFCAGGRALTSPGSWTPMITTYRTRAQSRRADTRAGRGGAGERGAADRVRARAAWARRPAGRAAADGHPVVRIGDGCRRPGPGQRRLVRRLPRLGARLPAGVRRAARVRPRGGGDVRATAAERG